MMSEIGVQHGYLPGLGVLTAWEALTKMLDRPNLFEADFKGFFDNVTHSGIADVLRRTMNYPESEINFLMKLNSSIVDLPDETRINETRVDVLGNLSGREDRAMRSMVSDEGIPPSILIMLKEGGSFAYAGD